MSTSRRSTSSRTSKRGSISNSSKTSKGNVQSLYNLALRESSGIKSQLGDGVLSEKFLLDKLDQELDYRLKGKTYQDKINIKVIKEILEDLGRTYSTFKYSKLYNIFEKLHNTNYLYNIIKNTINEDNKTFLKWIYTYSSITVYNKIENLKIALKNNNNNIFKFILGTIEGINVPPDLLTLAIDISNTEILELLLKKFEIDQNHLKQKLSYSLKIGNIETSMLILKYIDSLNEYEYERFNKRIEDLKRNLSSKKIKRKSKRKSSRKQKKKSLRKPKRKSSRKPRKQKKKSLRKSKRKM